MLPGGSSNRHAEADRNRQRGIGGTAAELLADGDTDERVADANRDADERAEGRRQALQHRRPAGEDDLADAQRVGLALVELERGDELPREVLERGEERLPSLGRLLGRDPFGNSVALEGDLRLQDLSRLDFEVEGARQRHRQRRSAPLDYARELARVAVGDGERRALGADRDGHEGAPSAREDDGRRQGAQERESLEVDADETETGLPARERVGVDELAIGDDEEDPLLRDAVLDRLGEHLEVERGLVHGDGERLLGAEPNRVRELLGIFDARQLDRPDAPFRRKGAGHRDGRVPGERADLDHFRKIATRVATGQVPRRGGTKAQTKITVGARELEEYLGAPKVRRDVLERSDDVGVVTGLAWTPVGGDIRFIEASRTPGSGRLILTGQLGDVMKESAQAAVSLAKGRLDKLGAARSVLETNDLHIHLPAGAIPKDGPSAGITMTTALASLLSGRAVKHTVGMTGEVTLQGRVLPIGGLKQKVLAAHAAGLRDVILPERNRADLDDVPADVREEMRFHPVMTIGEVLELALEPAASGHALAA